MSDQDLLRLGDLLTKLRSDYVPPKRTTELNLSEMHPTVTEKQIRRSERTHQKVEKQREELASAIKNTMESGLNAYQSARDIVEQDENSSDANMTLQSFSTLLGTSMDLQTLIRSNPFSIRSEEIQIEDQISFQKEICKKSLEEIQKINFQQSYQTLLTYCIPFIRLSDLQGEDYNTRASIDTMEEILSVVQNHPTYEPSLCKSVVRTFLSKLISLSKDIGSFDKILKYTNDLEDLSDDKCQNVPTQKESTESEEDIGKVLAITPSNTEYMRLIKDAFHSIQVRRLLVFNTFSFIIFTILFF